MKVAAYKEHFIRRHYGLTLNGDYKMKKFTLSSLLAFTFFGLASCFWSGLLWFRRDNELCNAVYNSGQYTVNVFIAISR